MRVWRFVTKKKKVIFMSHLSCGPNGTKSQGLGIDSPPKALGSWVGMSGLGNTSVVVIISMKGTLCLDSL